MIKDLVMGFLSEPLVWFVGCCVVGMFFAIEIVYLFCLKYFILYEERKNN